MPEDQQQDGHKPSSRPHLRLRVWSEPTAAPAEVPPEEISPDGKKESRTMSAFNKTPDASPAKSSPFLRPLELPSLRWIPANWNWSKWKPVLRSALGAWISLLLFLIPTSLKVMGQAAFLIIIASFLSPPSDTFVAALQRELGILLFAAVSWAWSCLGIKLAYIARSYKDTTPSSAAVFAGQYLEPAPTIIIAVFLFISSFLLLYIKSRVGPSPLIFACIFGCICVDISLTTAVLFPFPYYTVGQFILIPLTFHSAISLTLSLVFFPTSQSAIFATRLQSVLSSLASAAKQHCHTLQQDVTAPDFSASSIFATVQKAEGALAMLASAASLQKLDVVYSRFAPTDFTQLYFLTGRLVARASGMNMYYTLIDPTRERFPVVSSIPATPTHLSAPHSRASSPARDSSQLNANADTETGNSPGFSEAETIEHVPHHHPQKDHHTGIHHRVHHHKRHLPHNAFHHSGHSHGSLLHFALSRAAKPESAVGVFESMHYLNLEATHLSHPNAEANTARTAELLAASCQDLLNSCENALQGVCDWLGSVQGNYLKVWMSREEILQIRRDKIKRYEDLQRDFSLILEEFINKKRYTVVDPYRGMFGPADDTLTVREAPSHRHLFHCYVYQYHLMRFATCIQDMLGEIVRLETEREVPRVWFPKVHLLGWVHHAWEPSEMVERYDDENPDIIPGASPLDLGQAVRRDPDALPPRNALEKAMNWVFYTAMGIGGGNVLFALKAAILTILLALPSFLKSSAEFAYKNKVVWAVIMGQLTLARFRGDTTFGLLARIVSTFGGGIIGMLIWYISTGSGKGNPFGLAAVCLVCFPFIFFFRLYWPVSPMTNLILWVTVVLVVGYSYQDAQFPATSTQGYGWDVAWRRFVLVTIGVTAAGIFSFLPPATTIRQYQRKTFATTTSEIGSIYCSVISFAHTKKEDEPADIIKRTLAILSKLQRSLVLKENIVYEFSLRGRWPAERYQRILELQMKISKLLSHLASVLEQMEPTWVYAFLKRTQLSNADFQGDVLAVMSLISSSLRTGNPLPQVTPCPLLNRFMERQQGLNIIHEECEEDFGLPKMLTEETLESLQYLMFSVGVSTAFGIVLRLDKLMVAVKELVGEQYHIDGIDLPLYRQRGRGPAMAFAVPTIVPGSDDLNPGSRGEIMVAFNFNSNSPTLHTTACSLPRHPKFERNITAVYFEMQIHFRIEGTPGGLLKSR